MNNVITVKYYYTQGAEDLFKRVDAPNKVYARQSTNTNGEIVFWLTTSKWQGGYEADCPLKEGLTVRVVDEKGKILFEEILEKDDWNGGTSAKKNYPFVKEKIKEIEDDVAKRYKLQSYNEWSKWMIGLKEQHGYKGYDDNWRFCEDMLINKTTLSEGEYQYYGRKLILSRERYRHKIAGREYESYWLKEKTLENVALCGYAFVE